MPGGLPTGRVGTVTEQGLRFARAVVCAAVALVAASGARAQSPQSLGIPGELFLPSQRGVLEEDWARRLARALGLEEGLPADATAEDFYSILCPEQALRSLGEESGGSLRVAHPLAPASSSEPVRVVLEAPTTALYVIQIEGVGLQRWSVDGRLIGHLDATPLGVAQAPRLLPLRAGSHEFTGILGRGARAERIELSAHRPLCIAPADGWRSGRPLLYGAKARTLVRALGLERFLSDAGTVVELEGERFDSVSRWGARTDEAHGPSAGRVEWARAEGSPAEFAYRVNLPEPGLFSLEARVSGEGPQLWSLDGRLRARVELPPAWRRLGWQHVLTMPLPAGEHVVRALIPSGAAIDRIRVVGRRDDDPEYVEVLEQMGFREGHVHAAVSLGDADATLRDPAFVALAADFLQRAAGGGEEPLPAISRAFTPLYRRPASPVLPAEL
ncbi:MAG TPA: hypothetical protein VMW19_14120 [Myxococcota bacterium]|nr:hypothetical protein [Myxococcota bacterium]